MTDEEFSDDELDDYDEYSEAYVEKLESLQPVASELVEKFEELGLYVNNIGVGSNIEDPEVIRTMTAKEIVESGEGAFFIMAAFRPGEVAWSQRILDPEGFALREQLDQVRDVDAFKGEIEDATERMIANFSDEDDDAS